MVAFIVLAAASPCVAKEVVLTPTAQPNALQSIVEQIRADRAATGDYSPVSIQIADGVYPITHPLSLEPSDSGISFTARPGAHPVIHGGKEINNWTVDKNGRWTTKIDPQWQFEALWVNHRRAVRARTPNKGFIQAVGQPDQPVEGMPVTGPASKTLISVAPEDAAPLGLLSDEEKRDVTVQIYHSWDVSRLRLAAVEPSEGKLQFTAGVRDFFYIEPWHRLVFENYLGALDEPGEWFLEKNGTLHYIPLPGEDPRTSVVVAPVSTQWLVLAGRPDKGQWVQDVQFHGLRFAYQQWMTPQTGIHAGQAENQLAFPAIDANGVQRITFKDCDFIHTMTHAMWLRSGCTDSKIERCYFQDLGAGGIYLGDPKVKTDGPSHTHHISVENCIVRGGGRHFLGGIGLTLFHASDCTIRHCDIGDFYYSAVSIGWTWGYAPTVAGRNLLEYCHLHHLGWGVLSDMGAVYTLGQQLGTVIRNNHMHDIGCASYGGWAMYNDEGSTGILWENNLAYNTQTAGYHQHYGRGNIVRNNILAWGKEEHLRRSKPEDTFAFAFERNIVLIGSGRLLTHLDKNWHDGRVFMADNVYWKPDGAALEFAGKTWAQWQAMGNDVRSVIADPKFVDPAGGDWSLSPDSPAIKLGFQPFDWKQAGVLGTSEWKARAAEPLPEMVFGAKPHAPVLKLTQNFDNGAEGHRLSIGRRTANNAALFVVPGGPASTGKCLELRDGPDQTPAFEPHFFFDPSHLEGVTHVSFDLRIEKDYRFLHEWRDSSSPYNIGVFLGVENGAVSAGGKRIATFPPLTWVHFEIKSRVGEGSNGTWDLTMIPPDGEPQHFENLPPRKGTLKELRWLGFISPGTVSAKGWIDNLDIKNH